ncbi:MAG: hypothetical protein KatS3mg031_0193 [Chitinophagales bacterium]|nr:MAG: hypothetical protein KatS3mg031_0193 [Chitinophagales bacterium]
MNKQLVFYFLFITSITQAQIPALQNPITLQPSSRNFSIEKSLAIHDTLIVSSSHLNQLGLLLITNDGILHGVTNSAKDTVLYSLGNYGIFFQIKDSMKEAIIALQNDPVLSIQTNYASSGIDLFTLQYQSATVADITYKVVSDTVAADFSLRWTKNGLPSGSFADITPVWFAGIPMRGMLNLYYNNGVPIVSLGYQNIIKEGLTIEATGTSSGHITFSTDSTKFIKIPWLSSDSTSLPSGALWVDSNGFIRRKF